MLDNALSRRDVLHVLLVPREQEGAFKADRLSPSHPGVGDGNDEEKVVACARQQGGAL